MEVDLLRDAALAGERAIASLSLRQTRALSAASPVVFCDQLKA